IVSGMDWHDAMIASPTAAIKDIPMLLVPISDNPILPKYKALLERNNLNLDRVYSYGEYKKETTPEILRKIIPQPIGSDGGYKNSEATGENKYVNSFAILNHQYQRILPYSVGENVFLTRGDDFADSLTVAPLAAKMSSPIVFGTTVHKGWSKWDEFKNDAELETIKIDYPITPEDGKIFCNKVTTKILHTMRSTTLIGGSSVMPENADDIFRGIWK
ncbi:cell wall-binding repeat-containing protein, partial [Clostridium senegalense]